MANAAAGARLAGPLCFASWHSDEMADSFIVRVVIGIHVTGERATSNWLVRTDTAEEAIRIVKNRVASGCEVVAATKAPAGTAESYGLAAGQAHHL